MPWQGSLDNYARVVLLCVSQCALELRARSFFFCVSKREVILVGLQGMFFGGVYGCGKTPSYAMLLGTFGFVS